jgi:Sec-independent protein secretion pathway component TatC
MTVLAVLMWLLFEVGCFLANLLNNEENLQTINCRANLFAIT